jgi:hypothetical protein
MYRIYRNLGHGRHGTVTCNISSPIFLLHRYIHSSPQHPSRSLGSFLRSLVVYVSLSINCLPTADPPVGRDACEQAAYGAQQRGSQSRLLQVSTNVANTKPCCCAPYMLLPTCVHTARVLRAHLLHAFPRPDAVAVHHVYIYDVVVIAVAAWPRESAPPPSCICMTSLLSRRSFCKQSKLACCRRGTLRPDPFAPVVCMCCC